MSDQDTIGALTQAIGASEAGRRVGWARAFSAEASKDELSRDVNMLRAERDIMRGAASFLYGFLRIYLDRRGDGQLAQQALNRWTTQVQSVLDPDVVKAGREAAEVLAASDPGLAARAAERASVKADAKRTQKAHDRSFKRGRDLARDLLAKQYGFENTAAMLNYLDQYR
jgi:hypothetical protein